MSRLEAHSLVVQPSFERSRSLGVTGTPEITGPPRQRARSIVSVVLNDEEPLTRGNAACRQGDSAPRGGGKCFSLNRVLGPDEEVVRLLEAAARDVPELTVDQLELIGPVSEELRTIAKRGKTPHLSLKLCLLDVKRCPPS